jgi:salicylate hydroxylase
MLPYLGVGATQALEDAIVLSKLLQVTIKPKPLLSRGELLTRVSIALKVYDRVRRPNALEAQRRSRLQGRFYSLAEGPKCDDPVDMERYTNENWAWCE